MPFVRRGTGSLEAGDILRGTYEILRLVGWGGMGEVYEARHVRLPGRFAIKTLTARVTAESTEFLRFRREAEITSSLHHPNIVRVFGFDEMEDGTPFLVMEFLEGRDLCAELEVHRQLSPARVADIVSQLASGLAAAHEQGIVHRDLKPQNVFLIAVPGQDRELVKILDFGICKARTAVSITTGPRIVGTPAYMSPEQARGDGEELDARTDQFALAAIAYEALSGRPAFPGDHLPGILLKVTSEDPPPVAPIVPEVSPAVDLVLLRALSKARGGRFDTVLQFAEAFADATLGIVPPVALTTADLLVPTLDHTLSWTASPAFRFGLVLAIATGALMAVFSPWQIGAGETQGAWSIPVRTPPPYAQGRVTPVVAFGSTIEPAPGPPAAPKPKRVKGRRYEPPRSGPRPDESGAESLPGAATFIDDLSRARVERPAPPLPSHKGTFVDDL